jgi:hypothetical protein
MKGDSYLKPQKVQNQQDVDLRGVKKVVGQKALEATCTELGDFGL